MYKILDLTEFVSEKSHDRQTLSKFDSIDFHEWHAAEGCLWIFIRNTLFYSQFAYSI